MSYLMGSPVRVRPRPSPAPTTPRGVANLLHQLADVTASPDKENRPPPGPALFWKMDSAVSEQLTSSPQRHHLQRFSPRKQSVENKTISLTPQRVQQPPRAWERRPATPFVPRSDGQKIWKRIPLQDIGLDSNSDKHETRRQTEAKKDYLRAIKRMKVDAGHGELHTQEVIGPAEPSVAGFLSTRVEEETIEMGGSPKKKIRHRPTEHECSPTEEHHDRSTSDETVETGDTTEEDPQLRRHELAEIDKPPTVDNAVDDTCQAGSVEVTFGAFGAAEVKQHISNLIPPEVSIGAELVQDELSQINSSDQDVLESLPPTSEIGHKEGADEVESLVHVEQPVVELKVEPTTRSSPSLTALPSTTSDMACGADYIPDVKTDVSRLVASQQPLEDATVPINWDVLEGSGKQSRLTNGSADSELTAAANAVASGSTEDSSAQEVVEKYNSDVSSVADPDLFDLSGPAAVKTVDAQLPDQTLQTDLEMPTNLVTDMGSPTRGTDGTLKTMTMFQGFDQEEDTAFLAEFLLRAKASKAAREAASQEPLPSNDESARDHKSNEGNLVGDELEVPPAVLTQPAVSPPAQEVEFNISSPLRRSNRTAVNRVPRPHSLPPVPQFGPILPSQHTALPNTIQLKRATGNEFIFTAKPQQTVQMMTRTNTKRNQGSAVHADVRLQQLKAEVGSSNQDTVSLQDKPPVSSQPDCLQSPSKKRKRTKGEDIRQAKKTRKNVTWQEQLASYREATPVEDSSSLLGDEIASNVTAAEADVQLPATDVVPVSSALPMADDDGLAATSSALSHDENEASKVKVRKLRKVNVGSVNGTPAPKTRTRGQTQAQYGTPSQADSVTASALRSKIASSSSSAIPLPLSAVSKNIDKEKRQTPAKSGKDQTRWSSANSTPNHRPTGGRPTLSARTSGTTSTSGADQQRKLRNRG